MPHETLLPRAGSSAGSSWRDEARAFWRLRRSLLANGARQLVAESRFRILLVCSLSVIFWLGLFWLFLDGFHFLGDSLNNPTTRARTIAAIFNVFFLSLLAMLIFSSGIILYSGLFRSRETRYLLTLPARTERIFLHKLQEAAAFSSWGFLLLGSPMLIAYGLVNVAPWYYYALLPGYVLSYVAIPAALGALACLVIVHRLPALKMYLLVGGGIVLLLVAAALGWSILGGSGTELMTPSWFQEILARLQFSEKRLLPSWWLTAGLMAAAEAKWADSLLLLCVLMSNALLLVQVDVWVARRLYRRALQNLNSDRAPRNAMSFAWLDRATDRAVCYLPPRVRLMIVNDLRLFRRDPVQWTQFLIFFGLLGLYFSNIRRLSYDLSHATWVNMISFLNLAVVGLILSTFTGRFVFPMISLEGRRFWILGRLPIARRTILWSKFLFAAIGSMIPCLLLVVLSDLMLRVVPEVFFVHLLACVLLCLGLSGLAVGMGAMMPNLREESPSKIAAGFGGTLNLVVSTIYIAVIVFLTALPSHFYLGAREADPRGLLFNFDLLRLWMVLGAAASVLIGLLATILPLRMGFRAFDELEF
jgi:ABC-2 type transport system permease protein